MGMLDKLHILNSIVTGMVWQFSRSNPVINGTSLSSSGFKQGSPVASLVHSMETYLLKTLRIGCAEMRTPIF